MEAPASRIDPIGLGIEPLITALTQHWRVFVLFAGTVMLTTWISTELTPKKYTAIALIQLLPRAGQEIDVQEVQQTEANGFMEQRDNARTQIQLIYSRSVRKAAIERYNALGYDDIQPDLDGLDDVEDAMDVGPRENTQLVEIAFTHRDPDRAAILANLIAESYRDQNLEVRTDAAQQTRQWLEGQSSEYRTTLGDASAKVLAFKEEHDLVDIEEKVDDITKRMDALQTALGEATTNRVLLESSLSEQNRLLNSGQVAVLAGMLEDPALEAMSKEHASLVTESADVLARYGEKHPERIRAAGRIQHVDDLIAAEVARKVEGERSQLRMLRRQETELGEELAAVKSELLDKQRLQEEYATLKLEEDRVRRLFGTLGERQAEVELQARTRLNDVRLVDPAVPPDSPSSPNLMLNLTMAFVVGMSGGLALTFLRSRYDDTLRGSRDLEPLHMPLLCAIPFIPETVGEPGLVVSNQPRSHPAEALRSMRGVLESRHEATRPLRLLVTSSLPGEGKTSTASGLAIAYAKLGLRTVLLDADLRRPRVHDVYGLDMHLGLADALRDTGMLTHVLHETDVNGLSVVPAGTFVEDPSELLGSRDMERLLERLEADFEVVIIDSPPTALVGDSLILSKLVNGVVLVARVGMPTLDVVRHTLQQLSQVGAPVDGIALNDVPATDPVSRYGYYGSYEATTTRKPAAK